MNIPKPAPWTGLPKMHKGGTVPDDGVYEMRKGEKVLTPEKQRELLSAFESVKKALSEPAPEPDAQSVKEPQSITIKRDKKDTSKFAVTHKMDGDKAQDFQKDGKDLAAHVTKHFSIDDGTKD